MIPYHQLSASSSEDVKGGEISSTITTTLPMAAVCHVSFFPSPTNPFQTKKKKLKQTNVPPWAMGDEIDIHEK